jgi:REP element-mobilizing transposase RayT
MPQSLAQLYVHIVYSTKNRTPWLNDEALRTGLHDYIAGICRGQDSPSLAVDGATDHVHILCRLSKMLGVAELIRELKRDSTKWVKIEVPSLKEFHWQAGYGAFSVSPAHVKPLKAYIANQMEHHRQISFQEEFRLLCEKYGVAIDERYVWD